MYTFIILVIVLVCLFILNTYKFDIYYYICEYRLILQITAIFAIAKILKMKNTTFYRNRMFNNNRNTKYGGGSNVNSKLKTLNNYHSINTILKIKNDFIGKDFDPIYEYKQIPVSAKYDSSSNIYNTNCHLGQRKLLLTEIEFYVKCVDSNIINNKVVIYPGSASCEHLPVILSMFPSLKFILIDPNYHSIDYKFQYIYQNLSVIDKDNLQVFLTQLKSANKELANKGSRKNNLTRGQHQLKTAKLLLRVEFLNCVDDDKSSETETYNTLNSAFNKLNDNPDNDTDLIKEMDDIRDSFLDSGYKNLIKNVILSDDRVFIIQDYMSIDLTEKINISINEYKETDNVDIYFLSDIRTNILSGTNGSPHDVDILWNYALQIIFLKKLNPIYSMLKFRPPFFMNRLNNVATDTVKLVLSGETDNNKIIKTTGINPKLIDAVKMMCGDFKYVKDVYGLDMIKEYLNNKFIYFNDDFIYIQPWSPVASTETRLFISQKNIMSNSTISNMAWKTYDQIEWENKFIYVRYMRMHAFHDILYSKIQKASKKYTKLNDYDGCYDCTRELMILGNYILQKNKFEEPGPKINIEEISLLFDSDKNCKKIDELYKLINVYTFYDVSSSNYKCLEHGNNREIPKKNIKIKYIDDRKNININIKIDKDTRVIKEENIT
jgi:hypothetical protein